MADLRIRFCGLDFANPFILAAAPSTDNREMLARGFEAGWAGASLKTTSLPNEEVSIAYPIMASLHPGTGMIGLQNIDLLSERHIDEIAEDIRWLKQRFPERIVIASLMARTQSEWAALVEKAEQAGADMIEASISCPQGAELEGEETQGWMVSQDPRLTEIVTRWVVQSARKSAVYVKIGSMVTDITAIGKAVERGGAQAICAIDSIEGISGVDLRTFAPQPSVQGKGTRGGYSGRAIKPVGLRCVADLATSTRLPISGVGGIYDWRDALDYLLLGASTVQVCTAVMQRGYAILSDLCDGLSRWMDEYEFKTPSDLVGKALPNLTGHDHLTHGVKIVSQINPEACIGCGLCHVACADGGHVAIQFQDNRSVEVDRSRCVGCGLCAQVCPVPECIQMVND